MVGQAHLLYHYSVNPDNNLWAFFLSLFWGGKGSTDKLTFTTYALSDISKMGD